MYYYKYNFVSPEPIYARVKEELKSYFNTGAVDDVLFTVWTEDCLRHMGRSSYKILPAILCLDDFQAKLPPDFMYVREAWLCTDVLPQTIRIPGSYYTQVTTRVGVVTNDPASVDSCVDCNPCAPDLELVVYKTNSEQTFTTRVKYLLKPGNVNTLDSCAPDCINQRALLGRNNSLYPIHQDEVFDINGNRFVTNFRQGDVYLLYYSNEGDKNGYQLIPDNFRIQEYIRKYIMYQVFLQLWNQITDETFNQIEKKMLSYRQDSDEAYILADIEIKKQDSYTKARAIYKDRHRYDKYKIR